MSGQRDKAAMLLKHYLSLVARKAGVPWDRDNDAEVDDLVDALIDAAAEQAADEAEARRHPR